MGGGGGGPRIQCIAEIVLKDKFPEKLYSVSLTHLCLSSKHRQVRRQANLWKKISCRRKMAGCKTIESSFVWYFGKYYWKTYKCERTTQICLKTSKILNLAKVKGSGRAPFKTAPISYFFFLANWIKSKEVGMAFVSRAIIPICLPPFDLM